jgi:hypothetical protein
MTTRKNGDGELTSILIACGIFTIALILVDIFYGNMSGLLHSWIVWPFTFVHVGLLVGWIFTIAGKDNPNLDWLRGFIIALAIGGLLIVLAHRNAWLDENSFKAEVEVNKQEQVE